MSLMFPERITSILFVVKFIMKNNASNSWSYCCNWHTWGFKWISSAIIFFLLRVKPMSPYNKNRIKNFEFF